LLPWLDSGRMEIWVHRNGQYAGRFSESAIREKVADGSLSATDLAWDEAKSAWKPISELLAAFPSERLEESRISDTALRRDLGNGESRDSDSGSGKEETEGRKPAAE